MHYLPNEVKSLPWKFGKLFSYNNEDKPVSSFFFDSYFDSYYVNVALNDSMDQWEKVGKWKKFYWQKKRWYSLCYYISMFVCMLFS